MSGQENEALVRRFLNEADNRGTLGINDELLTADCVLYTPAARWTAWGLHEGLLRSIALNGKEARCALPFDPP